MIRLLQRPRWFTALLTVYVLLALAGGAAAIWATLGVVSLDISTATLQVDWIEAESNDDGVAGTRFPGDDGTDPTAPEPDPQRTSTDLASCTAAISAPDVIDVAITKGFPSYTCTVQGNMKNVGELPVKLQGWALTGGLDSAIGADAILPPCGLELIPGVAGLGQFWFQIADASDPGANYIGAFTLEWVESNAFDPAACP